MLQCMRLVAETVAFLAALGVVYMLVIVIAAGTGSL
jgi:hypothetical protein